VVVGVGKLEDKIVGGGNDISLAVKELKRDLRPSQRL